MINEILTTLHPDQDPDTNLYPNVKKQNIPNGSIDRSKLSDDVNGLLDNIGSLHPSGVDTSSNILSKTSDEGIWVGSDTGKWYYWDGSHYVEGGLYQAVNIDDGSVGISQLDDELRQTIFTEVYTNITSQCGVETGHYINRDDGSLLNSGSAQLSDYIDLTQTGDIYVTGKSQYLVCLYAFYDGNKNFISTGGYDGNNEKYWVREKIEATGNIVYVRCCSYQTPLIIETFEHISKIEELSHEIVIDETHLKNITSNYELLNVYVDKRNGNLITNNNSKTTPLISCSTNDIFYISGESAYDTCLIATYNENNQFLRYYGNTTSDRYVYKNYEFIPQSDEKYVRFCGYEYTWYPLIIKKQFTKYELKEKVIDLSNETINLNVLYGKKYVACGDSFTQGDLLDIEKTYPNLIGKRNDMIVINMGRNGGYAHYDNTSLSFLNSTSTNYYQRIPKDSDYITLAFGLNELENAIGDETSTDNTTIWGAYNEVLNWIFTNIPNAKVGIISNDSWFTESFRDVLKSIAKYWGISFLDLKGENVPLMIGGKYYNVSQTAIDLRNSMYKISSSNRHPNELGQKIRSYIIENWLRSI